MSRKRRKRARLESVDARRDRSQPAPSPSVPTMQEALPPSRRWLFRGVILAAPWLFFLVLELTLRLIGYGVPMDFVLRRRVDGELRLLSNPYFTRLFFDPSVARLCPPFSLAVRKPPNTCRVFVLGSSAAQGDPEPGFGLARMLEALLRDQYLGVEFEVVNMATTAINLHTVYWMTRACLDLEPDVFVLYTGNNEVVGPFGAGTTLTSTVPNLTLIRTGLALRSTRLGQLAGAATRATEGMIGRGRSRGSWAGMEMFVDRQVRASDPALERTYGGFERNLTDVCRAARQARVPIVLSTVAVNLRNCAPFGSLHSSTLSQSGLFRWEELYRAGVKLQEQRRWAEAKELFRSASEIDDQHAELHYRLGRCVWSLGQFGEARERHVQACDLDTLRFRADTRINEIIRRVAGKEASRGVRLVDAAQSLAEQAPYGTPGEEAFLDHVHLTFTGNYLVGVAVLEQICEVLPDWVRARGSARPVLSETECARRLIFTELDRYMLAETMLVRLKQPPFTTQMDHGEQVERFSRERAELRSHGETGAVAAAVGKYENALADERVHWSIRERYATIARRMGRTSVAEQEWRRLAHQFPQYPSFHLQLARALRDGGRYAEAQASYKTVLEYQPESALTLSELAKVALLQGRERTAVDCARRAVELDPSDANALYVLAASMCRQQACSMELRAQAIDHLARALEIAPDSDAIRRDLARAQVRQAQDLLARGDQDGAIALLNRALEVQRDMVDAHEALGMLYQKLNEREKAVQHLSAALQVDPNREGARRALAALTRD